MQTWKWGCCQSWVEVHCNWSQTVYDERFSKLAFQEFKCFGSCYIGIPYLHHLRRPLSPSRPWRLMHGLKKVTPFPLRIVRWIVVLVSPSLAYLPALHHQQIHLCHRSHRFVGWNSIGPRENWVRNLMNSNWPVLNIYVFKTNDNVHCIPTSHEARDRLLNMYRTGQIDATTAMQMMAEMRDAAPASESKPACPNPKKRATPTPVPDEADDDSVDDEALSVAVEGAPMESLTSFENKGIHWHLTPWFGCINSWFLLYPCFRWSILFTNLCLTAAYLRTRKPRRPWKPAFAAFANWRKVASWMFLSGCTRSGGMTQAITLIWHWSSKRPTSIRTQWCRLQATMGFLPLQLVGMSFPFKSSCGLPVLAGYLHQAGEPNVHGIWKAE